MAHATRVSLPRRSSCVSTGRTRRLSLQGSRLFPAVYSILQMIQDLSESSAERSGSPPASDAHGPTDQMFTQLEGLVHMDDVSLHAQLRVVQQRLGTPNERSTDLAQARCIAHELNNRELVRRFQEITGSSAA